MRTNELASPDGEKYLEYLQQLKQRFGVLSITALSAQNSGNVTTFQVRARSMQMNTTKMDALRNLR